MRRLKQDEDIIKRALRNLPKKLEDIYVQIFELIPKDWPIVRHTLRCIYFHNSLFNSNALSLHTILDIFEHTETSSQLYNEENLMEILGCLIRLSYGIIVGTNISDIKSNGPSFAHYTVREFLEGKRVSEGMNEIFASSGDIVLLNLFERVLEQATQEPVLDGLALDELTTGSVHELSWRNYALMSATVGLYTLPRRQWFESRGRLRHLCQEFVRAFSTRHPDCDHLGSIIQYALTFRNIPEILTSTNFQFPRENEDLAILSLLLIISEPNRNFSLAQAFIQDCQAADPDVLQHHIFFRFYSDYTRSLKEPHWYEFNEFNESLVNAYAQLSWVLPNAFEFLINQSERIENPTLTLLSHIGAYHGLHRI